MSETVGSKLLGEIERVSAKRERWRGIAKDMGPRVNFGPAIFLMTQAIDAAKSAMQGDDPAACIAALLGLEGFDDND